MGYSSDVRMVIRGPQEVLLREFAILRLNGDDVMKESLDEWVVMESEPIAFMATPTDTQLTHTDAAVAVLGKGGVNWKWSNSYPEVQAHTKIYGRFEELYIESGATSLESFLHGAFVRIGEDENDVESNDFGEGDHDLARPVRSIDCFYDDIYKPDLRPRLTPPAA